MTKPRKRRKMDVDAPPVKRSADVVIYDDPIPEPEPPVFGAGVVHRPAAWPDPPPPPPPAPPEPEPEAPRVICPMCRRKMLVCNLNDGYNPGIDKYGFASQDRDYTRFKFDPNVPAHAAMFHLDTALPYQNYPFVPSIAYSHNRLTCPSCHAVLGGTSGFVQIDRPLPPPVQYFGAGIVREPAVRWEEETVGVGP